MKTNIITLITTLFVLLTINTEAQYPYGILPQRQNMQQEVWDAYVNFRDNHLVSSGCPDPSNMLRELHGSGETRVEYQTFALLVAIYNDDWPTFRKLWRYCKAISAQNTKPNATVVFPWYANSSGQLVGKAINAENSELVVALYEASVRDPSAVDHDGVSFRELAAIGADELWYHDVCTDGPYYSGILGGAGWKCGDTDQFIYLHYASPWGYFQRFADASGDTRWIEPYTLNGRSYEAADDAIRDIFLKHINNFDYHTFCHTMVFDGAEAGSNGTHDANSTWFGWGQARGLFKNAVTYTNWGHPEDYEINKFMADFYIDKTGGDPANIANGYNCTTGNGGGDPKPSMVGTAALACMIDAQYQDFVNACWDWMVNNIDNYVTDHRESLMGAAYMMAMAGQMNLQIGSMEDYININIESMTFPNTGGTESFDISSDLSWDITTSDTWFSVNANSGSNDATITVTANANGTTGARTGTITVENTSKGVSKTIEINQMGPTYTLTVINGSGGGDYESGKSIAISADPAQTGYMFDEWTGDVANVSDVKNPTTTITIGSGNATITASYAETNDIILQAEDADNLTNATVENSEANYNGTGYVKFSGGASIEFTSVDVGAGFFDVIVRSTEEWPDPSELIVNGITYNFDLPASPGSWAETTISNVQFQATGNSIKLKDGKQQKIDQLTIKGILTGIGENQNPNNNLLISPNPATNGKINIIFKNNENTNASVTMHDISGRVIYKHVMDNSPHIIHTNDIVPGIYIISIETLNKSIKQKVFIK
jgi:hypothetical protein